MTRRTFLGSAAAAAAAPYVIASTSLGAEGVPPASERLGIALIGSGPQGTGVMRAFMQHDACQVLAVCDVNRARRLPVKKMVEDHYAQRKAGEYKGCADMADFREVCARTDIDAVIIGTPDHWHALIAIEAARQGKDMYCEKPLTLTVAEGRAVCNAIQRYGRIFQHGTQQRSDRNFRHAAELALNGYLGDIRIVKVAAPGSVRDNGQHKPAQPPEGFDYNFWLGQAPETPYYDNVCQSRGWYHMSAYTAGFISGWGVHHVDSAHWGMGVDATGPVELEGKADIPTQGLYDCACTWDIMLKYTNGLTMHFTSDNISEHGVRYEGAKGWVHVKRGFIDAEPKSLLTAQMGPNDKHLIESRSHQGNLLDCMKTRQPTVCPVETGHRANTVCLIGDIAIRLGRKLKWDPVKEQFPGDDEASRMLSRAMRPPWNL
jgi:predicted dehydrogenase